MLAKLRSFQFSVARSILFTWIRPTILGCNRNHLELQADDIVCYVMPFKSTADLLVLDQACRNSELPRPIEPISDIESRAFFFLGHTEGRMGRKTLRQQSARMGRLLEHQSSLATSVKIVPVSFFWGHQPDREKSIFKLLFSDNWTVTSRFKKLLATLFHPNHILVQFSKPVSLQELTAGVTDPEKQRRKLHRLLRVHFNRQRQAIIGPDLSHRRTLINSMLTSPAVLQAIEEEAREEDKTQQQLEKKAMAYANEIASHQSYRVIRFFYGLLRWLWNKLYEGIEVSHIDTAKQLAESHEVVYIPCHRSHIDYLLLSYVLYLNGLTPPHIAAGENLNLPVVGPLLRRAGAFFMRRSFAGDALYRAVFDEYIHLMFTRGYSVEYFIEGGRSRTGRTLAPRTGMLSMTARSFQRDSSKPIAFLPVYFGYERILEASSYLAELTGKSKKKESIFDIFGIFRTFKHAFGKVAVSFGNPVELDKFLDQHLPGWDNQTSGSPADDANFSRACSTLSILLASRINDAVTVNPVNLVATAILCTPRQTIEQHRLESQVNVLRTLARATNAGTAVTQLNCKDIISQAEKITGIERNQHKFGDILRAPAEMAVFLTYYRNNTVHVFILASLIARVVQFETTVTTTEICRVCEGLYPYLQSELYLSCDAGDIPNRCIQTLDIMSTLDLLSIENDGVLAPAPTTDEYASLMELGGIVEPTLERFHIVIALLQKFSQQSKQPDSFEETFEERFEDKFQGKQQSKQVLEKSAASIAHQLSAIYRINSPEFFDQSLFARFISTLSDQDGIVTEGNKISPGPGLEPLNLQIEKFLDNDVRYNVMKIISQMDSKRHQSDSISQTS